MATKKKGTAKKVTRKKKKEVVVVEKAPVAKAPEPSPMPAGKWHAARMRNPGHGYKRNDIYISPVSPGYATAEAAMQAPTVGLSPADLRVVVFVSKPIAG
jgi:hypothetical protein